MASPKFIFVNMDQKWTNGSPWKLYQRKEFKRQNKKQRYGMKFKFRPDINFGYEFSKSISTQVYFQVLPGSTHDSYFFPLSWNVPDSKRCFQNSCNGNVVWRVDRNSHQQRALFVADKNSFFIDMASSIFIFFCFKVL